jgi:hypothetical protein
MISTSNVQLHGMITPEVQVHNSGLGSKTFAIKFEVISGRRGSNPQPSAWKLREKKLKTQL